MGKAGKGTGPKSNPGQPRSSQGAYHQRHDILTQNKASSDPIETAALGRPFRLGMLYDCRTDALIPGITLWNHDELQRNIDETQQHNSEFNITASDSVDEKSNSLKVSGSLKLSLLGGLVNVAGSAKYFQDRKKSLRQQRLTLQYKTTTKHETLTMSHWGRGEVSRPNVFEDDTATHVVTAILYGASAYFVFDRELSNHEDKKEVEGEAEIMMEKLKFLKVNAEASFNMDEKEKSAVEKFSCTYHGDFQLPSNPSSFIEAVDVYRQLPTLLGENGEHAVPVRVWLYPLVKLDSKAARLQRDISNKLITYSAGVIEDLNMMEMRCNDLVEDTAATTFSAMEKKLRTFMQNCRHYKLEFVQKLGSVLPSIRGGRQEESALEDILKAHGKSPFNSKDLDQWLTMKGKESDTIRSFIKQMEKLGVNLDDNLDDLLSDLDITNIVSFSFTSLDQPDSSLMKQSHLLTPVGMMSESPESDVLQNKTTEWLSADTRQSMRRQLQLFDQLKKQTNSEDTTFIVSSKYDERYPGACIFIYEDGSDEPVPFIPPSKPDTPTTSDVSYDRFTVGISDPDSATAEYRVEFRKRKETDWTSHPVQKNVKMITLSGLELDTKYEIRATAVGKLGYVVSSEIVTVVTAKPTSSPPTNLRVKEVKGNSITLTWSIPEQCEPVKQYIIEYKVENSSDWQREETKTEVYTFTLKNLEPNTTFSIRMYTDAANGVSKPGEEIKIKTRKGPLDTKRFTPLSGTPKAYLLKMTKSLSHRFNKKVFGEASSHNPTNKTIMLVGATGSGKTTLINGMINYVLAVDWVDNWRFKLIDEETNKSQAHSQTSEVTAYQIHCTDEFQVPYSLTIIDTPGFGDTRGIKQDKEITEKIREFFNKKGGIDAIDAVCFVVQSALARLTHTQRYIFQAILSVFGKDISNNIITLVTFADGKSPPVLEAITEAKIPCAAQADGTPVHFKFNNSVLFADNTGCSGGEDFDYMFWKMGKASMNKFFTHLGTMETQSLTLTKQVLQERKQLEVTVQGVQPLLRKCLSTMEVLRTTRAELDKHKSEINENKDFEYEVEVEKPLKIDISSGTFITNCLGCNYTCHYPCHIPKDDDKEGCYAMTDGNCRVCPGRCVWSVHFNMRYRWDIKRVKEKRTYNELKSKYVKAVGEKMNAEEIIAKLEEEYHQVQEKIVKMMGNLTKCLMRLKEIALRPDPLSIPDYIDLLIESEKQEARPGYLQRIKELHEVRNRAVLIQVAEISVQKSKRHTRS
ncbi:uncharacterized protein LOC134443508 [Engraulis encrasicolus]|uniref:uncharacterized protein LOC134443508 n=1 Tax=Engraulis encrasicolus TaxID=184585 RepID=UPI002FD047B2